MAITLSPAEVHEYTGETVKTVDVTDAADLIEAGTGVTPDEHNEFRLVPAGNVRRAWAIVAARLCQGTVTDGTGDIAAEGQGDYQYSRFRSGARVDQQIAMETDLLAGLPWTLLQMPTAALEHVSWRNG